MLVPSGSPDGAAEEDLPGELGVGFVGDDLGGGGPFACRGAVVAGEGVANAVGVGVGGVGIVGIVPVRGSTGRSTRRCG